MDDLAERVRRGDREAAAELIARYEPRVRLYAAKLAPRPGLAEDIAQKAFLQALQSIERYDPSRDLGFWLQGIVRHVALQEWRELTRRSRVERDDLAAYLEELAEAPADDDAARARFLKLLRGCIERLPDRAREMVKLHYSLGARCQEVAERLGIQLGAVKMALVRIRRMLRDCVEAQGLRE